MKYNSDEVIDRTGTNSYKWDIAEGELPMWVADIDFRTATEIIKAITERAEHGVFGYSTVPDEWYSAYINWWKNRHGIEYKKSELIFSTGLYLSSGDIYGSRECFLRMNIACPKAMVRDGLERLLKAVRTLSL